MRDLSELKAVFTNVLGPEGLEQVLQGKRGVINTCGSGMTAAIIWLALQALQVDSAIYDEVSLPDPIFLGKIRGFGSVLDWLRCTSRKHDRQVEPELKWYYAPTICSRYIVKE